MISVSGLKVTLKLIFVEVYFNIVIARSLICHRVLYPLCHCPGNNSSEACEPVVWETNMRRFSGRREVSDSVNDGQTLLQSKYFSLIKFMV